MKNKEFWLAKKELDTIEARLEGVSKEASVFKNEILSQNENNASENEKKMNVETGVQSAIIAALAATVLAILNVVFRPAFDEPITWSCLVPSIAAFPIIMLIAFPVIFLKKKHIVTISDKIAEIKNGVYEDDLDCSEAGIYEELYANINAICNGIKGKNDDLHHAIKLANAANEAKSSFLSNISHEIRTPINAIVGMNEMIVRETKETLTKTYCMEVKEATGMLITIVDDLLDSSRIEAGSLELAPANYNVDTMLAGVVNNTLSKAKLKGLKYVLDIDPTIPNGLYGDEIRIRQCILNLATNAVKYTEKGEVELKVGYEKTGNDEILLTVAMKDTGIGISKDNIEKIFEPFERLNISNYMRASGTGLGITITRALLNLMGSDLKVESVLQEGSTFSFSILQHVTDWKMTGNVAEKIDRNDTNDSNTGFLAPNAHILVVDDSSVNLMIVQGLLKDTEIVIDTAESGKEAVSLAKVNKYDIAFVDHMMPEMDGIETMRHIRNDINSLNRRIPIIVFTANVVSGAKDEYLKEGFTDFLSKPVDPKLLEKAVYDYLPKDKLMVPVKKEDDTLTNRQANRDEFLEKVGKVKGIVTALGLSYAGGLELYKKVVEEFSESGMYRADLIEQYFEQGDVKNYTIQVHALKSAARLIGAQEMSELAALLEDAGKNDNLEFIEANTGKVLKMYRETVSSFIPVFESDEALPEIDDASLKEALMAISEMVEAFDFDSADSVMKQLKGVKIPANLTEYFSKLKTMMAEVARDDIIELVKEILAFMKQ